MSAPSTPTGFAIDNKAITEETPAASLAIPNQSAAFRLTWGGADATANYRVQYKLASSATWLDGAITAKGAAVAKLFGLATSESYDVRVRGENTDGNSSYATLAAQSTPAHIANIGDITVPSSVTAVVTDSTATISIADSSANEGHWVWSLLLFPSFDLLFGATVEPLDRVFTIPSLAPATSYVLQLYTAAYTGGGTPLTSATIVECYFTTAPAAEAAAPDGITGPGEIVGAINSGLAADFTLSPPPSGSATWSISGAPPGVAINGTGSSNVIGRVTGEPAEAGPYDAIVFAQWVAGGGEIARASIRTRFLIEGGAFLTWLNNDPANLDVQVQFSTREIASSKAVDGVLWRKAGDAFSPFIVFRDVARILSPAINALRLKLILADTNWNAMHGPPPILDLRPAPPIAVFFAGHRAYSFASVIAHPNLTRIFDALNAANSASGATVNCLLELSWKQSGQWASSKFLKVLIGQDAIGN